MSVVIETTLGDITVDLFLDQRPVTCLNFLKLCKMKYYNYNLFHSIRSGFIAQTGDPTGEGSGGMSIFGILEGPEKRLFSGEKMPKIRHTDVGLLSMVCTGEMMVGSQFFFTLASDLDSLDGIHCVIGEVTEGHDVLRKLNDVICDEAHRPYRDVRITHTVVLEDPFNDPPGFRAPSRSPSPSAERLKGGRIAPDEDIDETQGKSAAEVHEMIAEKEAKARATILEIIGDIPDADIAPPENVLFVCKLNPVTTDDDLEIIFSRFGKIVSCEVIRDKKTGDSLQYAFIEFADKKSCEDAYFKMDNVLIDDRRIHVDFSQSVSKIKWLGKGRGVKLIDDPEDERGPKKQRYPSREREQRNGRDNYRKESYDRERNEKERSQRNRNEDVTDRYEQIKDRSTKDSKKYNRSQKDSDRRNSDRYVEDRLEKDYDRGLQDKSRDRRYREEYDGQRENDSDNRRVKQNDKNYKNENNKSKYRESNTDKYRQDPEYSDSDENIQSQAKEHANDNKNTKRFESDFGKSQIHKERTKYSHSRDKVKKRERESERNSHRKGDQSTKLKRRHDNNKSSKRESTKRDLSQEMEPKTPSPISNKKNKTVKNKKQDKHLTKKRNKKRKESTSSSSESDSSTSSSSTESSSSSDDDKKKKSKKRKRSYSSSSSSSSESSSSSSSSSSTSSSESDSEPDKKKRRKKNLKKKSR